MRRRLATTAFIALTGMSSHLAAVGLGRIEADSALNEPLSARIPLISAGDAKLDRLEVALASSEQFERANVPRPFYLTRLNFAIERGDDGRPYVRVTSDRPVEEPFLDFLVNVEWSQGSLLREFTVLLDPPVYTDEPAGQPAGQAIARSSGGADSGARTPPASAAGSGRGPASATGAGEAPSTASGGGTYGPVQANDTLWSIASAIRPSGASVRQTMMALLRANPEAFIDGNINRLKRGAVLRLPDAGEVTALSDAEARRAVSEQMQVWRDAAGSAPDATSESRQAASGEQPSGSQVTAGSSSAGGGKLRVVAPARSGGESAVQSLADAALEPAPENVARLQEKLTVEQEGNAGLRARIEDLKGELAATRAELERLESSVNVAVDVPVLGMGIAAEPIPPVERIGTETASADAPVGESAGAGDNREAAASDTAVDEAGTGGVAGAKTASAPPSAAVSSGETTPPTRAQPAGDVAEPAAARGPVEFALEMLLANRLLLLGTGGLVLLLVLLLVVMRRRGAREAEDDRVSSAPSRGAGSRDEAVAEDISPLEQADFFMAYGRYAEAQAVLDDALGAEPDNQALRTKLLEVLARQGDRSGFEAEAQVFHTQLDSEDDARWQHVVALGRELAPEHPLFGGERTTAGETAPTTPAASAEQADFELPREAPSGTAADVVAQVPDAGDSQSDGQPPDLDFELEPGEGELPSGADDESGSGAETTERDLAEPLEFEWDAGSGVAPAAEDTTTVGFGQSGDDGLDFELPRNETGAHPRAAADDRAQDGLDDFDLGDLEFDLGGDDEGGGEGAAAGRLDADDDLDEVTTKLDLARAYLEMGDDEGAHALLDEVIEEGNAAQREEAEGLRRKAG